ncbi:MAG: porin, partial [Rhizobiales bacterium]|nr:porin [Hyphomicrobiales bacterium]
FIAIAGAQAADLPGKAAPAEYVRICDTYGAGFFFIPGTDTCLRIGGFVRVDYQLGTTPGSRTGITGAGSAPTTFVGTSYFDQLYATSARLTLNLDARSNTEYGLLRAFGQFSAYRGQFDGAFSSQGLVTSGAGQSPRASAINVERAFIQFAGFTFGFSASFFNFYQGDLQYSGNFAATARSTTVLAYTASFGQGFSATLSVEDSMYRRYSNSDNWTTTNSTTGAIGLFRPTSGLGGLTYGAQKLPDIVANLRVDQGWGSAQLMGALHQLTDYGSAFALGTGIPAGSAQYGFPTQNAGDKLGWALGGGVRLNLDMLARGDVLWLQAVYADGALDYAFGTANQGGDRSTISGAANFAGINALNTQLRDGIVATSTGAAPSAGNPGSILTTKAWSVAAGFRHFWTPALRSSIFGAYTNIDAPAASTLWDVKYWNVGVNTIWSPVRNLDLGLEVVYHNIQARTQAGGIPQIAPGQSFRGQEGAWVGTLRVQRNF